MDKQQSLLSQAKGSGSAKSGLHHWLLMKLTAIALIPLTIWFAFAMIKLSDMSWEVQRLWVSEPIHAFFIFIFVVITSLHSANGFQVILEDYIHSKFIKFSLIYLFKAATYLACLAALFSILFLVFNH